MVDGDGTPLSRRYYCPADQREVDRSELVRGYETETGRFVVLTEEELEALEPKRSREIDLRRFVPLDDLDPVFFERPYILTPADGSSKAYRLLARTMGRMGRAGLATFVMRTKEYLVAIIAEGGVLRAETMRFPDEIRDAGTVGLPEPEPSEGARVRAMVSAIEALTEESLDGQELEDRQAQELETLVDGKLERGEDVVEVPALEAGPRVDPGRIIDLMEVLKRSLTGEAGGASSGGGPSAGAEVEGDDADLSGMTKAELYERAKALDLPGRSTMNKAQLLGALQDEETS